MSGLCSAQRPAREVTNSVEDLSNVTASMESVEVQAPVRDKGISLGCFEVVSGTDVGRGSGAGVAPPSSAANMDASCRQSSGT